MTTNPPSAKADPELLRRATEEGLRACAELLRLPARAGAASLAAQIETGRFPPDIEDIARPLQNADRVEGLLFQTVIGLALQARPGFRVLSNEKFSVTDADRSLVASLPGADISTLRPPQAGFHVANFEFDHVAYNPVSGELIVVDEKRSLNDKADAAVALKEASLAVRRAMIGCAGKVNLVMLRWYAAKPRNFYGLEVTTRENVDAVLKTTVREAVDTAQFAFRGALIPRLREDFANYRNDSNASAFDEIADASKNIISFEELRQRLAAQRQPNWRRQ